VFQMTKELNINVDSCEECPFGLMGCQVENYLFCTNAQASGDRMLAEVFIPGETNVPIPDWCPLPNKEKV